LVFLVVSPVYALGCRLFELVMLLARGERSKELEILVLRHEVSSRSGQRRYFTGIDGSSLVTGRIRTGHLAGHRSTASCVS
jgi:hypothetical protein